MEGLPYDVWSTGVGPWIEVSIEEEGANEYGESEMKHVTTLTVQSTTPPKANNDSKFVFVNNVIDTAANALDLYTSLTTKGAAE